MCKMVNNAENMKRSELHVSRTNVRPRNFRSATAVCYYIGFGCTWRALACFDLTSMVTFTAPISRRLAFRSGSRLFAVVAFMFVANESRGRASGVSGRGNSRRLAVQINLDTRRQLDISWLRDRCGLARRLAALFTRSDVKLPRISNLCWICNANERDGWNAVFSTIAIAIALFTCLKYVRNAMQRSGVSYDAMNDHNVMC